MQRTDCESVRNSLTRTNIVFNELEHTYKAGNVEYKGITSTLIPFAYPDTYCKPTDISEEQWAQILKRAAAKGTAVHESIQNYCAYGGFPTTPEAQSWMKAEEEYDIAWIENEYLVTSGEFASKIDILAFVKGELSIIDIKRTSQIHYDTTALQTSLYKMWFEKMNNGLQVKHLYIFWCRDEEWKLVELPPVAQRDMNRLIRAYRRNDKTFVFRPQLTWLSRVSDKRLAHLLKMKKKIDDEVATLQKEIEENMSRYEVPTVDTPYGLHITYVQPSSTKTFDKARFEQDNPGVLECYMKENKRKGFIKISTNKDK